jgi:hypothetical protein
MSKTIREIKTIPGFIQGITIEKNWSNTETLRHK